MREEKNDGILSDNGRRDANAGSRETRTRTRERARTLFTNEGTHGDTNAGPSGGVITGIWYGNASGWSAEIYADAKMGIYSDTNAGICADTNAGTYRDTNIGS